MSVSRRGFLAGRVLPFSGAFIAARGMEAHLAEAGQGARTRSRLIGVAEIRISSNENPLGPGKACPTRCSTIFRGGPIQSTAPERSAQPGVAGTFKSKRRTSCLVRDRRSSAQRRARVYDTGRGLVTASPSLEKCHGRAAARTPFTEIRVDRRPLTSNQ